MGSLAANEALAQEATKPINILLITADDLNCNSLGAYGSGVHNISPNIDRLANNGIQFMNAHVASAVSQPSRGALATGRFPHNSGIEGFYHTQRDIPAIVPTLRDAGYYCALLGKMIHSSPTKDTPWDYAVDREDLGMGRDSRIYQSKVEKLIGEAKLQNRPFYIMVNSHDPHRPFHSTQGEKNEFKDQQIPQPSYIYNLDEIEVPGFLPDIPPVREEIKNYYNSVKRLDDTVGAILQALKNSGEAENTIVFFLSDNGISEPFSKTNCYYQSTRTPLIVWSPNKFEMNRVEEEHMVSSIDFFPTVLDIIGLEIPKSIDGRSFKTILEGEQQQDREYIFTQFQSTNGRNAYPMRAIQSKEYIYIFNPWAIDKVEFYNDSRSGMAARGMAEYGATDKFIKDRYDLHIYRVVEEFYDLKSDPNALNNLMDDAKYAKIIKAYQKELSTWMKKTDDPATNAFEHRDDIDVLREYVKQTKEYLDIQHKANKPFTSDDGAGVKI